MASDAPLSLSEDPPLSREQPLDGADTPANEPSTSDSGGGDGVNQQQQQQQQEGQPNTTETAQRHNRDQDTPTPPPPEKQAASSALCGVCQTNPPKYKCPRCRLPYCSVACNKTHRENHPPDADPKLPKQPANQDAKSTSTATVKQEPSDEGDAPALRQGPQAAAAARVDPSNPFSILENSDKLKMLFAKYPNLPDQLLEIHAATQPPAKTAETAHTAPPKSIPAALLKGLPANYNSGYNGGHNSKKKEWNHDIGIQNGKAALRKARKADGVAGEAIREYTELVLHIMNEASRKGDSASYLQRQIAEQDTQLIQRLLDQEKK